MKSTPVQLQLSIKQTDLEPPFIVQHRFLLHRQILITGGCGQHREASCLIALGNIEVEQCVGGRLEIHTTPPGHIVLVEVVDESLTDRQQGGGIQCDAVFGRERREHLTAVEQRHEVVKRRIYATTIAALRAYLRVPIRLGVPHPAFEREPA